ncbi:hypothetical protein KFE96_08105 [Kordiimonas sp. SCSIO 12603]|uniref:hypothetical protein n=1 Tax=Kordiimonas sp. SCSIO 12603 TaxID=2829596 RepID=UPI002102E38A|nr:hypothetical protein [Kordiimonas sp. SCSIO 12603]UTW60265.1 hypothetical protein KFE96_08105 [Kordiimonas sp. SCSIO 12603]
MEINESNLAWLPLKIILILVGISLVWVLFINFIVNGFDISAYNWIRSFGYWVFFFGINYFVYGKPNITAHRELLNSDADQYLNDLNKSLSERGLYKLVLSKWFLTHKDKTAQ